MKTISFFFREMFSRALILLFREIKKNYYGYFCLLRMDDLNNRE